ncbi:Virulence protein [Bordetella ansorpii]|uniref:Virulence protein n=1 Tax=Bordetella ansorpii TaxID=288768 RepID=A0A157KF29_9BORD|nr:Virulence protein [Bordetella ansorpii]
MSGKRTLIRNSTAEFLIFTGQAGEQSIEARYEDETLWLSQKLMAELFGVDVRTVSEHLKNIFASHELTPEATIRKFRIVQREGQREVSRAVDFYNLDAIISVGYRVNSIRATQFRQWATGSCVSSPSKLLSVSATWPKEPLSHPGITAAAANNPNCALPVFIARARNSLYTGNSRFNSPVATI